MRKRVGRMMLLLVAMGLMGQSSAWADSILFDRSALRSDWGEFSDVDGGREGASRFSFTEDVYVTRIEWWGEHFPSGAESPGGDDFTIRFYTESSGLPGLLINEFNVGDVARVDTGINTSLNVDVFHYEATIAATEFDAGTTYWLSIQNDTSGDASNRWGWHFYSPSSANGADRTGSGAWRAYPEHAYRLNGGTGAVVPLPAPAALGLLGMGLVATARRRKKSAQV